jgi:hypothetical protein
MEKDNLNYTNNNANSDFKKEQAYIRAKKKVDAIVGFYWHLAVYIAVNIFLILVIALNSNQGFASFGTYSTALFWGIGLFFHFMGVFGPNFIFGKDWENKKIEKYMKKEEKNWE